MFPARGLSDVTMERLLGASQERKCSVFAVMKNPTVTTTLGGKAREAIESFVEFVERTQDHLIAAPAVGDPHALRKLTEHFLEETGFLKELRRLEKNPEAAENRARNIKELAAGMDDAGGTALPAMERLQTFLEEITLDSEREEKEESAGEAVTLITMHSCKGLGIPPRPMSWAWRMDYCRIRDSKVEQTVDEERRLFFMWPSPVPCAA
jgi:superfamily I DNA/RNA helicase